MAKYYKKQSSENVISAEDRALNTFAEMLIEKIETLDQDWSKPWFTEGALEWATNLDGREYNGMNAFMLALLCESKDYKIPVFVTCNRLDRLNYCEVDGKKVAATDKEGNKLPLVHVLKGEKSFPVFLTTFIIKNQNGNTITKEEFDGLSRNEQSEYIVHPIMKVYNVFCVEQTNIKDARPELWEKLCNKSGQTKPATIKNEESFSFPAFDDMVESQNWICPIETAYQDRAYYSPSKDKIVLPMKSQFKDGESYYGTAFHECIHSTGHKDRLNRDIESGGFGSSAYAREELVAEMGAALVAHRYGFGHVTCEESCAYIKGWLKEIKQEPKYIKKVLLDVKHASYMLQQKIGIID